MTQSGGRITSKVHKLLNIGGMLNPSWIPNGRSTLYATPEKGVNITSRMLENKDQWRTMHPEMYALMREQLEENLLLRKIKEDQAVLELAIKRLDAKDLNPSDVLDNVEGFDPRLKMKYCAVRRSIDWLT